MMGAARWQPGKEVNPLLRYKMKEEKIIKIAALLVTVMFILQAGVTARAAASAETGNEERQWLDSLNRLRKQKDVEFKTSPTSPMAAVNRLTLERNQNQTYFSVVEVKGKMTISPQKTPQAEFYLENRKEQWLWERHQSGITCSAGNRTVAPGSPLTPGNRFQGTGWVITAYPSGDKLVLLVFDPRRPMIQHFSHLVYYPPDRQYAVAAVLKKFPQAAPVTMLTSQNLEKTFYRYAAIHFRLEGKELRLTAFKATLKGEDSAILFIPFGDSSNGDETYGSGRFLEIPEPAAAEFTLDFNLCFNPLCNYSSAYNCPLPPAENILDIPIKAGEKEYPH
jgi:uncharacterized protein